MEKGREETETRNLQLVCLAVGAEDEVPKSNCRAALLKLRLGGLGLLHNARNRLTLRRQPGE